MKSYGTTDSGVHDPSAYTQYREDIKVKEKDPDERVLTPVVPEVEQEPEFDPMDYAETTVHDLIIGSDYFRASAVERDIDPTNTADIRYKRLLADITDEYLDQPENKAFFVENYGEEAYHAIRLLGTAPYALSQQQYMTEARARNETPGKHAKETVIAFNHTMLKLIEANPGKELTDLVSEIDKIAVGFDKDAKGTAHNALLDIAYGVRTEYTFWQVVDYAARSNPNYKIRHGSEDEDSRGIDFIVTLPDGTELKIDVKSSETGVREKVENDQVQIVDGAVYGKTKDGQYVYYLQLDEDSYFRGTFNLEMGAKIRLRASILQQLQKMAAL